MLRPKLHFLLRSRGTAGPHGQRFSGLTIWGKRMGTSEELSKVKGFEDLSNRCTLDRVNMGH